MSFLILKNLILKVDKERQMQGEKKSKGVLWEKKKGESGLLIRGRDR